TIVTYGLHRHLCAEAAGTLAADGYSVEVIDLRTISPLDRDTVLASATKTGRVLVVHEDNISFGVGAEVAALVAEEAFYDLDAPVRRLAMADVPAMPFAAPAEAQVIIGTDEIAAAARAPPTAWPTDTASTATGPRAAGSTRSTRPACTSCSPRSRSPGAPRCGRVASSESAA